MEISDDEDYIGYDLEELDTVAGKNEKFEECVGKQTYIRNKKTNTWFTARIHSFHPNGDFTVKINQACKIQL